MEPWLVEVAYRLASFEVEVVEAVAYYKLAFPDNSVLRVEEHTGSAVLV